MGLVKGWTVLEPLKCCSNAKQNRKGKKANKAIPPSKDRSIPCGSAIRFQQPLLEKKEKANRKALDADGG